MTQREQQILDWIRENPRISQQELAEKAGITRSSVAVHISNRRRATSWARATSSPRPRSATWWASAP